METFLLVTTILCTAVGILLGYFLFSSKSSSSSISPNGLRISKKGFESKQTRVLDEQDKQLMSALSLPNSAATISISLSSQLGNFAEACLIISRLSSLANVVVILEEGDTYIDESKLVEIVPKHRLLKYRSSVGKVAFVRQMNPALHVEFDPEIASQLAQHVRTIYVNSGGKKQNQIDAKTDLKLLRQISSFADILKTSRS